MLREGRIKALMRAIEGSSEKRVVGAGEREGGRRDINKVTLFHGCPPAGGGRRCRDVLFSTVVGFRRNQTYLCDTTVKTRFRTTTVSIERF